MSLLSSYQDLITSEHKDKPKYMATVTALLRHSTDIYETAVYMDDFFDLDESEGMQQDILGILVGADREVSYQPDHADSSILNDEMYRVLLKAKIAKNAWKGGIADLQEIWHTLFGQYLEIIDNQDMTMDVNVAGFSVGSENDEAIKEMIQHGLIIPKPQSVGLSLYMHMDDLLVQIYTGIVEFRVGTQRIEISRPEGADIKVYNGIYLITIGKTTIPGISQPETAEVKYYTGNAFARGGKLSVPCIPPEDEDIPRFPLDVTSPVLTGVGIAKIGQWRIEISRPEDAGILANHGIITVQTGTRTIRGTGQPEQAEIVCRSGVAIARGGSITIDVADTPWPPAPLENTSYLHAGVGTAQIGQWHIEISKPADVQIDNFGAIIHVRSGSMLIPGAK